MSSCRAPCHSNCRLFVFQSRRCMRGNSPRVSPTACSAPPPPRFGANYRHFHHHCHLLPSSADPLSVAQTRLVMRSTLWATAAERRSTGSASRPPDDARLGQALVPSPPRCGNGKVRIWRAALLDIRVAPFCLDVRFDQYDLRVIQKSFWKIFCEICAVLFKS
jgi:hypothetical protein